MAATTLADSLKEGRYLDILLRDTAGTLIKDFVETLSHSLPQEQGTPHVDNSSPEDGVPVLDILAIGLAAFNAFLQANVTGPVLDDNGVRSVQQRFTLGGDGDAVAARRQMRRACRRSLDVDGVSVYEHIPVVELFCFARYIFRTRLPAVAHLLLPGGDGEGAGRSLPWLRLRVDVWHYKLVTQPSLGPGSVFNKGLQWCDVPSLQGMIETGLEEVEGLVVGGEGWSTQERVQFLVEKANVCIMLGQDAKAKETLRRATALNGFVYALSGALGKRTRFQEKSTSQLVVLAKSGEAAQPESAQAKPQALALNDDTLLENLDFTAQNEAVDGGKGEPTADIPAPLRDLVPDDQPQLSPMDQIILLAEATLKDAFSPADSLTSEEVLPFAVRVISDKSTNWQIYSHALLVRSRIEVHRSRTIERGVLQMQAVVDQVVVDTTQPTAAETTQVGDVAGDTAVPEIQITADGDEKAEAKTVLQKPTSFFPVAAPADTAPAQVRLEHIHALSSPPRWHLESELAYAWAGVGSLFSALEIFKRLRLWAEVALCFVSNAAKEDEDGRGANGEAKAKAVLRWRLFHKTGTPTEQQGRVSDEADEDVDLDELKEADYCGPERQPAPPNAPRLWCILGDIEDDPAHYERAWEISKHRFARAQRSLGEHYLQQREIVRAQEAYKKAVAVNRLSSELWNRLGDIELRMGNFAEAAEAFGRAIASSDVLTGGEDARTWSNLGSALYSLYVERVKELKKAREGKAADGEDGNEETGTPQRSPAALLSQALAAYKRGANIAHDNWRIWDNVVTLAARLRPPSVADLVFALGNIVRIRASEDALDLEVLRLLLNEGVLSKDKPAGGAGVYEVPRGTTERAVCEFLERDVAPLVTARSELWELIGRERVWRRDYAGAVEAAEKAWRAALGSAAGGLLPAAGSGGGEEKKNWLEDREAWEVVVERTDELVSMLENYGEEVAEIGPRWKGKARSAVRSVMGKARENWEGSEPWEKLAGLLEGLR
ncbi:TPR-like protein [Trichocladium antarcticum]|uniref:TPR-like protein n=1 Tax=Trichocladium antarcticum TaxID=1450529 RepID=A0AAN6UE59_9PEZI|nr:TPR-like protein [Trichocladium antarcticum]